MPRPTILLADDHHIVIEGLRHILEKDFDVIGVASDGQALVRAAANLKPDVIVADVSMPLLNGIEAARQIRKENPQARIVFLTMHPDPVYATEALDAGALGYVLKSAAGELLVTAIRQALEGRVYVTPAITARDVQIRSGRPPQTRGAAHRSSCVLTARQRQVARLYAEGRSTKEIADIMHVSARTVEFHKYRALEALGLQTSGQLIQYAVKHFA